MEKEKPEPTKILFKSFSIRTNSPEEFVEKLTELCEKYCESNDFCFNYKFEE